MWVDKGDIGIVDPMRGYDESFMFHQKVIAIVLETMVRGDVWLDTYVNGVRLWFRTEITACSTSSREQSTHTPEGLGKSSQEPFAGSEKRNGAHV